MTLQTKPHSPAADARRPVLLTGGTGFLGEHVVRALRQTGQSVRVLCRNPAPELSALGASIYQGDLMAGDRMAGDEKPDTSGERAAAPHVDPSDPGAPVTIPDELVAALDGCQQVYHLAGLVSRDPKKGPAMMRVHVEGTRRLMHAAKAAGVRRVLLASTSGTIAISRQPEPIPDESWPYPVELCGDFPYYLSKIYQEKLALDLGPKLGLEIVCVNPSLLLGPGDRRGSSTEDVRKFLCGEIQAIPSGGLSFVDVRDAAAAMVAAMDKGRPGARYLVGADGANRAAAVVKHPQRAHLQAAGQFVEQSLGVIAAGAKQHACCLALVRQHLLGEDQLPTTIHGGRRRRRRASVLWL